MKKIIQLFALFITSSIMIGCGGGDDNNNVVNSNNTQRSIYGVASKGPIQGGNVSAYMIVNGKKGDLIGTAITSSENGSYSISSINYSGPVLIEINGGSYKDEATLNQKNLLSTLRVAVPESNNDTKASITPLTEIAVIKAEKDGFTNESIQKSNNIISQLIGNTDILNNLPIDVTSPIACEGASQAQIDYSLMLAALSTMDENDVNKDIDDIITDLEDDLRDLNLDKTGSTLSDALKSFASDPNKNKTGQDSNELVEIIEKIRTIGIVTNGSMAEAKQLLVDIWTLDVNPENSDEVVALRVKVNEFVYYMNNYVEESAESHLMKAIAYSADIINSSSLSFVWNGESAAVGRTTEQIVDYLIDNILKYHDYENRIMDIIVEHEDRLNLIDNELAQAEQELSFSLSLTGFNTIYFDTTDVKIMRSIINLAKAACIYLQSLDYSVDNWNVTDNGNLLDVRDIEIVSNDQRQEFIVNNPSLFKYIVNHNVKLNDFQKTMNIGVNYLSSALATLEQMGIEGRKSRFEHAFNIDSEYDLYYLKGINEKMFASFIEGFNNSSTILNGINKKEITHSIKVSDDGYAYYHSMNNIYTIPYIPDVEHINLYETVNGLKSPRDGLNDFIYEINHNNEYLPYVEQEPILYKPNVLDVDTEHPIEVFSIPQRNIVIDGHVDDWNEIKYFYSIPDSDMIIKIAVDANGYICCYIFNSSNNTCDYFDFFICYGDSSCYKNYWWYCCYESFEIDTFYDFGNGNRNIKEKQWYTFNGNKVGVEVSFDVTADIFMNKDYLNSFYISLFEPDYQYIQKPHIKFIPE